MFEASGAIPHGIIMKDPQSFSRFIGGFSEVSCSLQTPAGATSLLKVLLVLETHGKSAAETTIAECKFGYLAGWLREFCPPLQLETERDPAPVLADASLLAWKSLPLQHPQSKCQGTMNSVVQYGTGK